VDLPIVTSANGCLFIWVHTDGASGSPKQKNLDFRILSATVALACQPRRLTPAKDALLRELWLWRAPIAKPAASLNRSKSVEGRENLLGVRRNIMHDRSKGRD
jgi:hypothetical protein